MTYVCFSPFHRFVSSLFSSLSICLFSQSCLYIYLPVTPSLPCPPCPLLPCSLSLALSVSRFLALAPCLIDLSVVWYCLPVSNYVSYSQHLSVCFSYFLFYFDSLQSCVQHFSVLPSVLLVKLHSAVFPPVVCSLICPSVYLCLHLSCVPCDDLPHSLAVCSACQLKS